VGTGQSRTWSECVRCAQADGDARPPGEDPASAPAADVDARRQQAARPPPEAHGPRRRSREGRERGSAGGSTADGEGAAADAELEAAVLDSLTDVVLSGARLPTRAVDAVGASATCQISGTSSGASGGGCVRRMRGAAAYATSAAVGDGRVPGCSMGGWGRAVALPGGSSAPLNATHTCGLPEHVGAPGADVGTRARARQPAARRRRTRSRGWWRW